MKRYAFTITIAAEADDPTKAWLDAVMGLSMDPGATPDPDKEEVPESSSTITIEVRGGCVVEVSNLPSGVDYELIDYDNH